MVLTMLQALNRHHLSALFLESCTFPTYLYPFLFWGKAKLFYLVDFGWSWCAKFTMKTLAQELQNKAEKTFSNASLRVHFRSPYPSCCHQGWSCMASSGVWHCLCFWKHLTLSWWPQWHVVLPAVWGEIPLCLTNNGEIVQIFLEFRCAPHKVVYSNLFLRSLILDS